MFDRITFDPQIMEGKACIRGTKIPVWEIVTQLMHSAPAEKVLSEYPDLEQEDLLQAMDYASSLIQKADEGSKADPEVRKAERFLRAIEQLGATNDKSDGSPGREPNIEIRLGAIHALGELAKDSRKYYTTVMEFLTAYVCENAPWNKEIEEAEREGKREPRGRPREDIQAILTLIGNREIVFEWGALSQLCLHHTDLRGASISGWFQRAALSDTNLTGAILANAMLHSANLGGAKLGSANLKGASLKAAKFERADLSDANLESAYLKKANLARTNLSGANLTNAILKWADLSDACLAGADLRGAYLLATILMGAKFEGANLAGVVLGLANLTGAHLEATDLTGAVVSQGELDQAYHDEKTLLPAELVNRANQLREYDEKAGKPLQTNYDYDPNSPDRPWEREDTA